MKKIIAFVLALVMCAVIFVGCDTSIPKLDDGGGISIPNRFIEIANNSGGLMDNSHKIYVDKETNVMYWYIYGGYHAGLTVMLNSDGTPMLYDFENNKIIEKEK
jgi:hypothetical protein